MLYNLLYVKIEIVCCVYENVKAYTERLFSNTLYM